MAITLSNTPFTSSVRTVRQTVTGQTSAHIAVLIMVLFYRTSKGTFRAWIPTVRKFITVLTFLSSKISFTIPTTVSFRLSSFWTIIFAILEPFLILELATTLMTFRLLYTDATPKRNVSWTNSKKPMWRTCTQDALIFSTPTLTLPSFPFVSFFSEDTKLARPLFNTSSSFSRTKPQTVLFLCKEATKKFWIRNIASKRLTVSPILVVLVPSPTSVRTIPLLVRRILSCLILFIFPTPKPLKIPSLPLFINVLFHPTLNSWK